MQAPDAPDLFNWIHSPDSLATILDSLADGITVQDQDGRLIYANDPAAHTIGFPTAAALLQAPITTVLDRFEVLDETLRPLPLDQLPGRRVLRDRTEAEAVVCYRTRATGEEHWSLIRARPLPIGPAGQIGVLNIFYDMSARRQAEGERLRLMEQEHEARARAEASERRVAFLAEASEILAGSLDYETTLATVARLAVPGIADWCAVDILDADGRLTRLAVTHTDPAKVAFALEIERRYPTDPAAPGGAYENMARRQTVFIPEITDAMIVQAARDAEHLALIRAVGMTAAIQVPLVAREHALGLLTLVSAESGRAFTPDDVLLAEDLARRAALAIDNAQLYSASNLERERFAVTLRSIGDAVIATDAQGRITFLNAAARELTAWPEADALGTPVETVFQIVNADTRAIVESPVHRVIREGVVAGLANHTLLLARDGTERAIDDSGAPIRDAGGALQGVVLVFRDVTARRESELLERKQAAAIAAERARLERILEELPIGVFLARGDAATRTMEWELINPVGQQILGAPRVTPGAQTETHTIHRPDGRLFADEDLPMQHALWRGEGVRGQELIFRYRSGGERLLLTASALLGERDGRREAIVVAQDITARKKSEDLLRFLIDASTQLSSSLDYEVTLATIARLAVPAIADNCVIDLVNEEATLRRAVVAAADPVQETRLRELHRRYPPDPRELGIAHVLAARRARLVSARTDADWEGLAHDAAHLALLREEGTRSFIVVPFMARDRMLGALALALAESGRHFEPADLPVVDELARFAGLAIDNARLYQTAQDAVTVRDEFLTIAAHELRTPLTAMLAASQLLQRQLAVGATWDARNARRLDVITGQTQRLNQMVLALLDLSRLQTGRLRLDPAPLDLAALVRRVLDEAQPVLEGHPVSLDLPSAPLVIEGDALRLEQVVHNLLQNAARYSPPDAAIAVAVMPEAGGAGLAVRDEGIGIPATALPRLFERFYRAPNAIAQGRTGFGIGLYVVHEIVTLHGGTIEVTSTEGAGTTFHIYLPLRTPATPDADPP